ncbi:MAG: S41 family peptidase [Bacteroidales bacterium]|nr:S41 family peptidase [Bacteroidales bacterium]
MKIEMNRISKKVKLTGAGILIIVISLGFVSFNESRDFKLVKNIEVFSNLFRELNYFYVDNPDPEKMIQTGIDAMLKTLDPYTVFIPESELENFNFVTTGQYGGVGSLIRPSGDYITISEVYKGFPADLAGLKAGDQIIEIDNKSIKGASSTEVSEMMKGAPDSDVLITVRRFNVDEPIIKTITRKEVSIPSVPYYGLIDDKTGYIRLSNFTQGASEEVKSAFLELKSKYKAEAIILDLRGNPGGLLIEAVNITNLFVDKGQEIVSTRGKIKDYDHKYLAPNQPVDPKISLAVLVDRGSASASEIIAGAVQDLDRGVILGERTYGKGLVQTTRPLGYNNQLKVTTAKYYIPSGRCIQALDYANRNEDGSVGHVPDSLITEFKTQHGRVVRDGGGIVPDIDVSPGDASLLTANLYAKYIFFDYATKYASLHESIPSIEDFKFTDGDFEDFKTFVKEKKFSYETRTERALQNLIRETKRDNKYEDYAADFQQLEDKLSHNLDKDIDHNKEEIEHFISSEIIGRYYYQAGSIKSTLSWDEDVKAAVEILSNTDEYLTILNIEQPAEIFANSK